MPKRKKATDDIEHPREEKNQYSSCGNIVKSCEDVLVHIFSFLSLYDHIVLRRTCKCMSTASRHPMAWLKHVRLFPRVNHRSLRQFCETAQHVPSLDFSNSSCTHVDPLRNTKVRTLDLHTSRHLTDVGGIPPTTENLNLRCCDDIQTLGTLPVLNELHTLDMGHCSIYDLDFVERTRNLTSLDLHNCPCIVDIGPLIFLVALQELDLSDCTGIVNISPLRGVKTLLSLDLSDCFRIVDVHELQNLDSLKKIKLNRWEFSEVDWLGSMTSLEVIFLKECKKLTRVPDLGRLSNLRHIELSRCGDLSDLGGLKSSTVCIVDLSNCVNVQNFTPLFDLRNLTHLNLSSCDQLVILPSLRSGSLDTLNLSQCRKLVDLSALSAVASLKHLDLGSCESLRDVTALYSLRKLDYLDIGFCFLRLNVEQLPRISSFRVYHFTNLSTAAI